MKHKQSIIFCCLLFTAITCFAQSKNPFASIGKTGEITTLTKGKYEELFDQDSIQQIGTALVNIQTNKVVRLLDEGEDKGHLDAEKHSRFLSVDPLATQFPFYSPYQFAGNKPIIATDLDGLEEYVVINYYSKTKQIEKTLIVTLQDKDTKQLVDMQLRSINKDGSYGELVAENKKVLVRNVFSANENLIVKKDEKRDALNTNEQNIYNKQKAIVNKEKQDPFVVQITEGRDAESEGEYNNQHFSLLETTKIYPKPNPIPFQGKTIEAGKNYTFEPMSVYLTEATPPQEGINDAKNLAKSLQNTNVKSITIQPYIVDGQGGSTIKTVMGNGMTQEQNFNANYQYLGNIIQKSSGVKVNVLPAKVRTQAVATPLEVKTN